MVERYEPIVRRVIVNGFHNGQYDIVYLNEFELVRAGQVIDSISSQVNFIMNPLPKTFGSVIEAIHVASDRPVTLSLDSKKNWTAKDGSHYRIEDLRVIKVLYTAKGTS